MWTDEEARGNTHVAVGSREKRPLALSRVCAALLLLNGAVPLPPALRKARREQQLVSKRLLREDAPEEAGGQSAAVLLGEAEVQQFLRLAQRGADEKEREKALASLRRGLQHPDTQQTFIRLVWVV